jgi:ribonuclease HII
LDDLLIEQKRLHRLTKFEREARSQGFSLIAGIDEAGRGPLAGPVVAAACIIPKRIFFKGINDSKLLSPVQRRRIYEALTTHPKVVWAVGSSSVEEIDRINIYQATIVAMQRALDALSVVPDYLLVDGMKLPYRDIPCQKINQGDSLSQSIAGAGIIAKETRDKMMVEMHKQWSGYGFDEHKGYGTPKHLDALQRLGPCPEHRRSFEPVRASLSSGPSGPSGPSEVIAKVF